VTPEEVSLRDLMEARFDATDEKIAAGHEASAREHAEVQRDIAELRGDFRVFKQYVYRELEPLKRDRDERSGVTRGRWEALRIAAIISAVGGTFAGAVIALVRTFIFPA
jgi:anti-sigma factor RsiW